MKRDLHSTITGWRWLDKLTLPFWAAYCKIQERRLYRQIGRGDAQRGRRILRTAVRQAEKSRP